jgi:hypothetical protein
MPAEQEVKDKLAEKVISDIGLAENVTNTNEEIVDLKTAALGVHSELKDVVAEVEVVEGGEIVVVDENVAGVVSDVVSEEASDVAPLATSAVPEIRSDEQKNAEEYGVKMEGDKVLPPLMGK